MKNLFDYIEEKGGVGFDEASLTEIDNVIFSRLIYLDYSGFTGKTLNSIADDFVYTNKDDTKLFGKTIILTQELLKAAANTKRFGDVVISSFKEITSASYATAFCAAAFRLTDTKAYIAIRGTDEKLMSFYEDAELAYSFPVPSQVAALQYVRKLLEEQSGEFYIGGHSKGGNSALFAYVFLDDAAKERITEVYNNDGPGFPPDIAKVFITEEINSRVTSIAPEDSIVGRMLDTSDNFVIIKSSAAGGSQHNVFTWIVEDDKFKRAEKFGAFSEFVEERLTDGLEKISLEDMKAATNAVYNALVKSGITSMDDINLASIRSAVSSLRELAKSDEEKAAEASQAVKGLIRDILESIDAESLKEKFKPKDKEDSERHTKATTNDNLN